MPTCLVGRAGAWLGAVSAEEAQTLPDKEEEWVGPRKSSHPLSSPTPTSGPPLPLRIFLLPGKPGHG